MKKPSASEWTAFSLLLEKCDKNMNIVLKTRSIFGIVTRKNNRKEM